MSRSIPIPHSLSNANSANISVSALVPKSKILSVEIPQPPLLHSVMVLANTVPSFISSWFCCAVLTDALFSKLRIVQVCEPAPLFTSILNVVSSILAVSSGIDVISQYVTVV